MKLLCCLACYDVVKLPMHDFRRCGCGKSKGCTRPTGARPSTPVLPSCLV